MASADFLGALVVLVVFHGKKVCGIVAAVVHVVLVLHEVFVVDGSIIFAGL